MENKVWKINLLIENGGDAEQEFNSNKNNHKIWDKTSTKMNESGIAVLGSNCNI